MFKMANQVIDAYDDIHWNHLEKIAEKRPQTNLMMPEEHSKLHDDNFALSFITKEATKLNKFPVNDYDNTWLSNEYFPLTHDKLEKAAAVIAATHIRNACEHFSIEPSDTVKALACEKVASNVYIEPHAKNERDILFGLYPGKDYYMTEKNAAPREDMGCFAEVDRICDNYTHAQYVFRSPHHIKVGCAWFDEKHDKMPVELRHKYAAAVQMRAQELGLPPCKGSIAKYAGDAYSGDLEGHMASRRRLLDGGQFTSEFGKIAAAQKSVTPYQFAQLLHAFDKKAGLNKFYGSYLKDPYQSTFASSDSTYTWMSKKSSRSLTSDEIEKVVNTKNEKIAEYFGRGMATEFRRDPVSIFESLPNDTKEIIANIHDGLL